MSQVTFTTRVKDIATSLAGYWVRLDKHRALVWKYAGMYGLADTNSNRIRLFFHDWDKYLPRRFYYYARYFNDQYSDVAVVVGFREESKQHVESNRHHWQFWADMTHKVGLIMPLRDMLEMVADWRAMSEEKGTNALAWYKGEKLAGRMILHPYTAQRVEMLLTAGDDLAVIEKLVFTWKSDML